MFGVWKAKPSEAVNEEALRLEFKKRYHAFRLLLTANNRALETMSELEQALTGAVFFDMAFVRSKVTGVVVNVNRMIRELEVIAPERYRQLHSRFADINNRLESIVNHIRKGEDGPEVIHFKDLDCSKTGLLGGKIANLADAMQQTGVRIPRGFAITTTAYRSFMKTAGLRDEINRLFQKADPENMESLHALSSGIRKLINDAAVPTDTANAVKTAMADLLSETGPNASFALRSSALGEDSGDAGFAGQFVSELNVSADHILDSYKAVIAGKYSPRAISYAVRQGLRDEDQPMAVGLMEMIEAKAGGVMYTRNPVDGDDDNIRISSVFGLPKKVVDGIGSADLFVIERKTHSLVSEIISEKAEMIIMGNGEGTHRKPVSPNLRNTPSLEPHHLEQLINTAFMLEKHFGLPQDIEWAIDHDDMLVVLQCRPLRVIRNTKKTLPPLSADDGVLFTGGVTAAPGIAGGEAFVAKKDADMLIFPKNAVLIVETPRPRWAAVIGRASAVISSEGGMANHLASVAREFEIPALFNVRDAMTLFRTGDRITVDADSGMIYRGIRITDNGQRKKTHMMSGKPVYKILKKVCRHITPLNLIDPDSIYFSPDNCTTLHDITRFIHEKSVKEMILFGKKQTFQAHSARQLLYKGAVMQWWILNLDDGFSDDKNGKHIDINKITSLPMKAFWDGYVAVPWEGPPAMDNKGFVSVMFQSTANPALISGIRTQYADQNYFMISKNYCSLNSRLGYHFCTMEALVGERIGENYVSFQFKGGAADNERKAARVNFIGDILEDFGFTVTIRKDHMSARMEARPDVEMLKGIRIIGYLSLHTRQLDMVMADDNKAAFYGGKFRSDIRTMLAKG